MYKGSDLLVSFLGKKRQKLFQLGLLFLLINPLFVSAQTFKEYKTRLKAESNKYRSTESCEAVTKKSIENLNNLIWADNPIASKKEEIIKSCGFLRTKGCPQPALLGLLKEISDFYKTGVTATTNTETRDEEAAPVSNMPDTLLSPEDDNPVVSQTPNPIVSIPQSSKDWTLYGITGLLTLLCLFLGYKIFSLSTSQSSVNTQGKPNMNNEMLEKVGDNHLAEIIRQLRDELGLLRHQIAEMGGEMQTLKSRISTIEGNKTPIISQAPLHVEKEIPTQEDNEVQEEVITREIPIVEAVEKRYALYMDNSEGFSVSGLMYHEGIETIYEIVLNSPRSASYRISKNKEAQSYALSDPGYYLRTACDYENSPSSNKSIETVGEGNVELIGNIWKITKRAKIRFV